MYDSIHKLIIMVAIDNGRAIFRHVFLVNKCDISEEQISRVPRE